MCAGPNCACAVILPNIRQRRLDLGGVAAQNDRVVTYEIEETYLHNITSQVRWDGASKQKQLKGLSRHTCLACSSLNRLTHAEHHNEGVATLE